MKRISLSAYDAEHVYEWLRMYWRGDAQKFGGCYECERTGRRLERLIGPAAVRRIARVVQENPGRTRTKKRFTKPIDYSDIPALSDEQLASMRRVGTKKKHAK